MWPPLIELDAYQCSLALYCLSTATRDELDEHFRYVHEYVHIEQVVAPLHASSVSEPVAPTVGESARAADTRPADDTAAVLKMLLEVQRGVLQLPADGPWHRGRVEAAACALRNVLRFAGRRDLDAQLLTAAERARVEDSPLPLVRWIDDAFPSADTRVAKREVSSPTDAGVPAGTSETVAATPTYSERNAARPGRRASDSASSPQNLRVDQQKIDRLMNLIGEMVVSKNALPYLANRAETVYGSRDLSREIKAQYAVINRIAEELQDAIMQVRMMPVSFVFQRFPRLVRDVSRQLEKEVRLVLEGEETEADKNVIEALADPLVHIVRNSLDHGLERPEARRAAGKPETGTLIIRASQESDRVVIEIRDDGKGIDPAIVKRKALERGLIDASTAARLSDQDAINLIFAAGFSTNDVVSDLSGRGVGMDVVRTAVEQLHGTVTLDSQVGRGTRLRLSLPLSMAVTNVLVVESDGRSFGVPMDAVVETVRVPRAAVRQIKQSLTTVLRGKIIPLKSINALLALSAPPASNGDDEFAVLVVRIADQSVGLLVDDFREAVDIILKPMSGVLAGLSAYAGSALLGDGSVLMVLNVKELL